MEAAYKLAAAMCPAVQVAPGPLAAAAAVLVGQEARMTKCNL